MSIRPLHAIVLLSMLLLLAVSTLRDVQQRMWRLSGVDEPESGPVVPRSPVARVPSANAAANDAARRYHLQPRPLATGFTASRGLAVTADGRIYLCGDQAVHILGPSGDLVEFTLKDAPYCLAISKTGLLYLGTGNHVTVTDHCGTSKGVWAASSPQAVITSVAVSDSTVWVADAGAREVVQFSLAGAVTARMAHGTPGADEPWSLVVPSPHLDVAVSATADGVVWIANPGRHQLQLHTADGAMVRSWGQLSNTDPAGFTGCCNPADFVLLPDGNFAIADKGTLPRIRVYDASGKLLETVADASMLSPGEGGDTGAGCDLATDAAGNIYALNRAANVVLVFKRKP